MLSAPDLRKQGPPGAELEAELVAKIREYDMTCVGPNCLGVVNTDPKFRLDACFAESLPVRGDIGFVSQSGALGGGILNILQDLNLGFAQFISIGNQADVNADSAIEYWENVDDVKQILLYMESIADPKRFRTLASRTTKKKPIIALKAGRSAAGASAASSHTGSLAGADKAADALLKQSGVIREFSLQDLFNTAKVFSVPVPNGNRARDRNQFRRSPELWPPTRFASTEWKWHSFLIRPKKLFAPSCRQQPPLRIRST